MLLNSHLLAAGFRDWDAGSWVMIMGAFFVGLFGGLGYLLKIRKGDTSATFGPADVMTSFATLTSKVDQNSAKIDAAHARLDIAQVPSASGQPVAETQPITLVTSKGTSP